jgi:hypothetical protein
MWTSCWTAHLLCMALLFDYSRLWFNRDGFVSVCLDKWHHTGTTPKLDLKPSRPWYLTFFFEKLEEWVVYRVLTLMCCFVCGSDRTANVSTRRLVREFSLPWLVWIDSRTSVKCVNDFWCIEGSCGHLFGLQTWYTGLSCYITVVCDVDWTVTVLCLCLCLDTWPLQPHTVTTPKPDLKQSQIWYLFWEVGGVSGAQSTDFDVLLCVWVWTVRLTSRLDL